SMWIFAPYLPAHEADRVPPTPVVSGPKCNHTNAYGHKYTEPTRQKIRPNSVRELIIDTVGHLHDKRLCDPRIRPGNPS
ncbi:MAG: hypothetical protein J2P54_17820, partial [Bradyrhizobiaceae bacterium]|nr:hypothetical protein [Bradyrhizobiaceae bacterium]